MTYWQAGERKEERIKKKKQLFGAGGAFRGDRHHIWNEHCTLCVCVSTCVVGETVCVSKLPVIFWHQFLPKHWRLCQRPFCVI